MSAPRRVVFDTSSLIGAALQPGSVPYMALSVALGMADVCASEATLAELEHVLGRPRLDRFQTAALRMEFAAVFRRHAHLFAVCRPPQQRRNLRHPRALQAAGQARHHQLCGRLSRQRHV
jgi:predicted nucleic acid-binding protein